MSTTSNELVNGSGYRLKFSREEYIKLLQEAKPIRLYKVDNFVYFCFDGFIMYCDKMKENDLMRYQIYKAIEFANYPWKKV